MSYMKQLLSIIETWKDPEEDPTGCELLNDECNEVVRGKKDIYDASLLAQLCISEWKEAKEFEYQEILDKHTVSTVKKDLIEGA